MMHGFIFVTFDDHHHESVVEYISEVEAPVSHDDICDFHFVFHQLFLLPENFVIYDNKAISLLPQKERNNYYFHSLLEFFRPPIFS